MKHLKVFHNAQQINVHMVRSQGLATVYWAMNKTVTMTNVSINNVDLQVLINNYCIITYLG